MMLAYHGRQDLKDALLAGLAAHREADRLVQGYGYWKDGRGCAVGCSLQTLAAIERAEDVTDADYGMHRLYERFMGVPVMLARLEDAIFEVLAKDAAQVWPERFARAITPGADLSMVGAKFLHRLLSDPSGGVQRQCDIRPSIAPSVQAVIDLYARWIEGTKPSVTEWREARSAAAAAAADAADAAARFAERQRQADWLIEILEATR